MGKAQIFIFHHKLYQICPEVHFLKSFPLPLTASEEQYYLQKYIEGDLNAKHILIEHNLRLVAHIVKKYQEAHRKIEEKDDILKLYQHVESKLSTRERLVLKMRYGLYNEEEYTQREIAKLLGISRSYVSRIEKSAIEKLRGYF